MCLNEKAAVNDEVRRVINNGFFTHHPFKYSSAQLEEYLRILPYIRELPGEDYNYCLEAIERTIEKMDHCPSCYLKGLAYLMILTEKHDPDNYEKYSDQYYKRYNTFRTERDFELEVWEKINEYGIDI